MTTTGWSFVLQWSRLGVNAVLFFVAARYLSLAEIGVFATAFAPVRLMQGLQKSGIGDAGVLIRPDPDRINALATLSFALGTVAALILACLSTLMPQQVGPALLALSALPLLTGLAAPSEAVLRQDLRIRALALRTVFAQGISTAIALWVLAEGWGFWALVVFAILNAALTTAVSLALAGIWPRRLPGLTALWRDLPLIGRLALRDLATTATQPILQFALGVFVGLPAAGAFQIAARLLGLIDALAISPIRFLALPRLTRSEAPSACTLTTLHNTALLACFVYPGAIVAGPDLVILVIGPDNGAPVLALLPAFCILGLLNALAMPITQALTASGHTGLTLIRAMATLALSLLLAVPTLGTSLPLTAAMLPLAAALILLPYVLTAARVLQISIAQTACALRVPTLCGLTTVLLLVTTTHALPNLPPLIALIAKITAGTLVYLGTYALFAARRPGIPA
jgi:O-antigen/teichoic acid export membrane protein